MLSSLLNALLTLPLLAAAAPFTPSLETDFSNLVSRQSSSEGSPLLLDFPIHESCNASQKMQIERGLFDTKRLSRSAVDHLLHHGNTSDLFLTYFGRGADPAIPIGYFERILEVSEIQKTVSSEQNLSTFPPVVAQIALTFFSCFSLTLFRSISYREIRLELLSG